MPGEVDEPDQATTTRLTQMIDRATAGNREAADELLPLVYGELRKLASARMNSLPPGQTLQPTALVHEAFGRLIDARAPWEDRAHFFAIAATTMRRILVEHARRARRPKRGGDERRVTLDDGAAVAPSIPTDVLALDVALDRLRELDERKSRAVELHYFGGLTYDEGASVLGVSSATFHRDLRLGRAWLQREMGAHTEARDEP